MTHPLQHFAHYAAARARRPPNRRRHERAPFHVRLQLSDETRSMLPTALDISEGGLRIVTDALQVDTRVTLRLPIPRPGGRQVTVCQIDAVVVWRREGESGLAFVDPPPQRREQLRSYIHRFDHGRPGSMNRFLL